MNTSKNEKAYILDEKALLLFDMNEDNTQKDIDLVFELFNEETNREVDPNEFDFNVISTEGFEMIFKVEKDRELAAMLYKFI